MVDKFNPDNKNRLESEDRKRLLSPHNTLELLGYKANESMADVGCGIGLFTFQAANIGGESAKIYAIDISDNMLSEVKKRAKMAGYSNIVPIKSDEYDFKLITESVDFVLICTVLHEIDDKNRFLKESSRICRNGGKIAIIEFNETQVNFGPPLSHRLSRNQVLGMLADVGFNNTIAMDISEAFFAVTASKVL